MYYYTDITTELMLIDMANIIIYMKKAANG